MRRWAIPPFYLMFGRVPRLTIDILFCTVLHDSAVASYDKYVACLANDLREAIVIAQDHAAKEQNRHAELYNWKVKGSKIDIGDRVLLANRKERGKKKLVDRWESTIYTVVNINAETHTYRIQDTVSGREKVVHRNLLMLANFLPMEDPCNMSNPSSSMPITESSALETDDVREAGESLFKRESETPGVASASPDSGRSRNSHVTEEARHGSLTDPEPVDSERRTIEWITQLSAPSLSEANVTDITSVTHDPQTASLSPADHMADQSVPSVSRLVTAMDIPAHVRQPDPALNTMTQTDSTLDIVNTVDQASSTHCSFSDTQPQVRSRFSRLVKPVNRLIQTMSRQDVVQNKFDVKAVCKSMFQVFAD